MATPFVQGHLRDEALSFVISTECAHCGQPLTIDLNSALQYRVQQPLAEPLVFLPLVNFSKLCDQSIIDAF